MSMLDILRGSKGQLSFSRTQAAIGFVVSSIIIAVQAYHGTLSETVFGLYFGFCTAGYLGGKQIAKTTTTEGNS